MKKYVPAIFSVLAVFLLTAGCIEEEPAEYPETTRDERIPADAIKVTPETDVHPPILHSVEFEDPIPIQGPINTAGGEDSPFVTPDGNTFYFFFTPDVSIPPEKQLLDEVTGIWVSHKVNGTWSEPERVWLQDANKLALDGAHTIVGDRMYFASAREGYTGLHWFTADLEQGEWTNWDHAGDRLIELEVGELHFVGDDLYFHSEREGGEGALDIWMMTKDGGDWTEPVNLQNINTDQNEGWPYVSADGKELWFTRRHLGAPSLWRSFKVNGTWQDPELMVETFAAEATLDDEGNLYFAHHYFKDDVMIEADLYVCYRK